MALLEWKPEYAMGVPAVDHEHRELIELINCLFAQLENNTDTEELAGHLGDIHSAIAAHFALEESLMRASHYPEYAAHKEDHEALLDQVRDFMDLFAENPVAGREVLQQRMGDWFTLHFSSFDARLHRQL